jgi:hypothetical protein
LFAILSLKPLRFAKCQLFTYDAHGYIESGLVYIQLKATDNIKESVDGNAWDFRMEIAHYNAWTSETLPVFLVLYDAQRQRAYFLYVQRYFEENASRRPRAGAQSVTVHIPKNQRFSRNTVRYMRNRKQAILNQMEGMMEHGNEARHLRPAEQGPEVPGVRGKDR